MTFYNTNRSMHLDGTPVFQTEADRKREAEAAVLLQEAFNCKITHFAPLALVDWYAERDGRVVGLIELKARDHNAGKYSTVWLAVRKYMCLSHASASMNTAGIFAVKFNDGLRWVSVWKVDASKHRIAGTGDEIEPVIDVPILQMRKVGGL